MDDITRDLEREIARIRPRGVSRKPVQTILITDDFGRMRNGNYLRHLNRFMGVLSLLLLVLVGTGYAYLLTVARHNKSLDAEKNSLEEKVVQLTQDRELLMARLVLTGNDPGSVLDQNAQSKSRQEKKTPEPEAPQKIEAPDPEPKTPETDGSGQTMPASNAPESPSDSISETAEPSHILNSEVDLGLVRIEKFSVTRATKQNGQVIRFDIRNASGQRKEISGRIFTMLKQDGDLSDSWRIVPDTPLQDTGLPEDYRKGVPFSILHFRPIKINVDSLPENTKIIQASILVFDNSGRLILSRKLDFQGTEDVEKG